MALFSFSKNRLEYIEEVPFKLEKDIQNICEENLNHIFSLELVRSEFSIGKFRIDTLAYDNQNKSFVIIEYKRDRNYSVIDQGYAYLSLMLNNKADFILEYNENCQINLKRKDIDWSQSRVVFISPSFTNYQKEAINFKDLPIELWEIRKYENDTIHFTEIKTSGSTESINSISGTSPAIKAVSKEVKVYTESEHLQNASEQTKELYENLRSLVLNIADDIKIKPTKVYVGFISKRNIIDIHIQKNAMKIWINLPYGKLDDSKNIMRNVSKVGHWGNGDYELQINNDDNIDYIMSLVKQSYRYAKGAL